ncbi:MAG TPA: glycosyltransferase family 39 protein [Acetobacteraceae bacterium]|nr:glycosyltransferase family 39 protein [Acetobacteraceae bacterium]
MILRRIPLATGKCATVLLLAGTVLILVATQRSFEYDEAYSVFVTSPAPRPRWPENVFRVGDVRGFFHLHAGPAAIAAALRATDVHPPLYFWALGAWRAVVGDGLVGMRLLSILFALCALALVGAIARRAELPPVPAMLLTLGSYGFAYTATVARGFALAQALALLGVLLALRAEQRRAAAVAAGAGVAFGTAMLANYLAAFVAAAALGWLALAAWGRPRIWLAAWAGFAIALPPALWFFLAQRNSRTGQFPPFHLLGAVRRLALFGAADLLGGLPEYAEGPGRIALEAVLALLLALLALAVARVWRRIGTPGARLLLLASAAAPAAGLLLLGAVFGNTPVELRYLCFATPFAALLLAGALAWRRWLLGPLLAVQAVSIAGLATQPATMQPFRAVARAAFRQAGPDGVILAPLGNDGVGAVGPLLAELPDAARVLLIPAGAEAVRLGALPPGTHAVLAPLGVDEASRAVSAALAAAVPGIGPEPRTIIIEMPASAR